MRDSLVEALETEQGLCGMHEPAQVIAAVPDQEMRLRMLTLGAILDVFPLRERWTVIAGLADHWLMDIPILAYRTSHEVAAAFQEEKIAGPTHSARTWWQVCRAVQGRFKGPVRDLLRESDDKAGAIQTYLAASRATFPVLAGPVISARWLDLVDRIGGVQLSGWETLRVKLSARERASGERLGIPHRTAHPWLAMSLRVWKTACQGLGKNGCGFRACPNQPHPHK